MHIYFLLVKSLHEKQQRKERLWGTDLGIRTLTKELEVPSKPNLSPIPWLPLPMHCSTRPHPQGGRAQTPAHKPKEGGLWRSGKNLRELLNILKLHKINTTIRELLNAQRPQLLQKSPSCRWLGGYLPCFWPLPQTFTFGHDQLLHCIKSNALTGFNTVPTVL